MVIPRSKGPEQRVWLGKEEKSAKNNGQTLAFIPILLLTALCLLPPRSFQVFFANKTQKPRLSSL